MNNIILIGFMGCGKTTVGIKLSYKIKRTMVDTDKQIEREQGKSISDIFAESGEAAFREMETSYLQKMIYNTEKQIISVGGGLPIQERNHALLHELGKVVYLRATSDTIYERLKNDTTRPLLQGDNPKQKIEELMQKRAAIYEKVADVIIDVDGKSFDVIIDEIITEV